MNNLFFNLLVATSASTGDLFATLLGALFLTAMIYMAFPLIRLAINHGKFEPKRAKKIALWNSIIVGVCFFFLTAVVTDGASTWNAAPAVLYYWINRSLLTDKYASDTESVTTKKKTTSTKKSDPAAINHPATPATNNIPLAPKANNVRSGGYPIASPVATYPSANAQSPVAKPILFCRKCGSKLATDAVFCSQCGTKISK